MTRQGRKPVDLNGLKRSPEDEEKLAALKKDLAELLDLQGDDEKPARPVIMGEMPRIMPKPLRAA